MVFARTGIRRPRTAQPVSMSPRQVAQAYNFPLGKATGKGCKVGIIELGGGFSQKQVAQYFSNNNLKHPTFVAVGVAGGSNAPDGPDGADGEVQLDMIVPGAIAPDATYNVYFAPNTDQGFLAAIQRAISDGCHVITISWGQAEDAWSSTTINEFEATLSGARAKGIPVFVASGDTGSTDSESHNVTDFPASSPSAIGCGGTRLELNADGSRASEVVWNDDSKQSATGGGVSKVFPGRDVPDIAANADPDTGYEIMIDGQGYVIGGTSAVAPLMAGLYALLFELHGATFDFMNLIATNPQACFDVTAGNNGGYRAGPGRDQTTGFGVPDGSLLEQALSSGIPAPVPPTPQPTPTPTPTPQPTPGGGSDFPVAAVDAWFEHKHNHSHVESEAATEIYNWAKANGINLGKP